MQVGKGIQSQEGFTYLAVLFMVAVAGVLAAANGVLWSSVKAQEDGEQLQFAGAQIRKAISSYYEQSPGGVRAYPRRLEDLLKDERFAVPKRHLRRMYLNPFTDRADWQVLTDGSGGIVGVMAPDAIGAGIPEEQRRFVYVPIVAASPAARP